MKKTRNEKLGLRIARAWDKNSHSLCDMTRRLLQLRYNSHNSTALGEGQGDKEEEKKQEEEEGKKEEGEVFNKEEIEGTAKKQNMENKNGKIEEEEEECDKDNEKEKAMEEEERYDEAKKDEHNESMEEMKGSVADDTILEKSATNIYDDTNAMCSNELSDPNAVIKMLREKDRVLRECDLVHRQWEEFKLRNEKELLENIEERNEISFRNEKIMPETSTSLRDTQAKEINLRETFKEMFSTDISEITATRVNESVDSSTRVSLIEEEGRNNDTDVCSNASFGDSCENDESSESKFVLSTEDDDEDNDAKNDSYNSMPRNMTPTRITKTDMKYETALGYFEISTDLFKDKFGRLSDEDMKQELEKALINLLASRCPIRYKRGFKLNKNGKITGYGYCAYPSHDQDFRLMLNNIWKETANVFISCTKWKPAIHEGQPIFQTLRGEERKKVQLMLRQKSARNLQLDVAGQIDSEVAHRGHNQHLRSMTVYHIAHSEDKHINDLVLESKDLNNLFQLAI